MARNQVQFQKGLSEARFAEIYGTEEQCHAALVKWRWPNGFECPGCNGADHCVVTRGARRLFQCNACRKQTSVKAGTIFASSKLPLRIWFKTIYLVTQSKKGISSIELGRRLGVTQTAAWMMKHKLAQVMLERNASKRLKGNVQMDDAYIGGVRVRPPRARRNRQDAVTSPRSRQRTMASQIKSSFGPSKPSAALRSESSRAPRSTRAPISSPTVWHASPLSPKPDASTPQSRPEAASKRLAPLLSNGSIPRWAISKPPSWGPTEPCKKNTFLDISRSSNINSIADTISKL